MIPTFIQPRESFDGPEQPGACKRCAIVGSDPCMIGIRKKKDSEAEKDITKQNQSVLVGSRSAYFFERLSRDLRPRFCTPDVTRHIPGCLRWRGQPYRRSI